jgi:hypothetical protein
MQEKAVWITMAMIYKSEDYRFLTILVTDLFWMMLAGSAFLAPKWGTSDIPLSQLRECGLDKAYICKFPACLITSAWFRYLPYDRNTVVGSQMTMLMQT